MIFRNREALQIENDHLRVTVLTGGGHIAEILHRQTGVNPLWIPPWPSIEPTSYDPHEHPRYGRNEESRLLAGIMGHNLCLDFFGPPAPEDVAAGVSVHGEAPISRFEGEATAHQIQISAVLPVCQLRVSRSVELCADRPEVQLRERVENLSAADRPIGWTQHVTLGPPFLVPGETRLHVHAERSRVFEAGGFDAGGLRRGADFIWPHAPLGNGASSDLGIFAEGGRSASFTTHLLDRGRERASFIAFSPSLALAFGYSWRHSDFAWLGIWEENRSRSAEPWNSETIACGLEFGVSPFPETREQMLKRASLFGVPTFRTLPARGVITVEYSAFFQSASAAS